MYEKISLLKPPKDKNGYPIHSDGSRFSIFIILKAKENNLLYYRQNETYLPKPSLYPIHETALCPEVLVWNRIAQKYKLRYINQPIYQVEYQGKNRVATYYDDPIDRTSNGGYY